MVRSQTRYRIDKTSNVNFYHTSVFHATLSTWNRMPSQRYQQVELTLNVARSYELDFFLSNKSSTPFLQQFCIIANILLTYTYTAFPATLLLHTAHFTLRAALFALYTILRNSHCTCHTSQFIDYTSHITFYTSHFVLLPTQELSSRFTIVHNVVRIQVSSSAPFENATTLHTGTCGL